MHGENIDAATAVQLAKTMIRDGQIPTPEEAERQLEERLERDLGELAQCPSVVVVQPDALIVPEPFA